MDQASTSPINLDDGDPSSGNTISVDQASTSPINLDDGDPSFDSNVTSSSVFNKLQSIRIKHVDKIIVANLNINSIAGKFDQLKYIIGNNVDILIVTETKIGDSHPNAQFKIDGFSKPFRRDRNPQGSGGGILIYVREDIPCKQLNKHTFPGDIEGMFIEINLRKTKWLLFGTYHPPNQNDNHYFDSVTKAIDIYHGEYDHFLLVGDFNAEDTEPVFSSFIHKYNATNLVKDYTCFKSIINPSCIDLFITNKYRNFQNTTAISTGLSDFHKMSLTVMKTKFKKQQPKVVHYRDYKNFNDTTFGNDLQLYLHISSSYDDFEKIFLEVLELHAPLKQKIIRANEAPYMTRCLKKAIMKRSELESKYFKSKSEIDKVNYKRHKNYVSRLYKREMKSFYRNLDLKSFLDNKKFWKNVKPLFSDKAVSSSKITLLKGDTILSEDQEIAETFNDYFENVVKSLEIPINLDLLNSPLVNNFNPIDNIINKFASHPSILKIREKVSFDSSFKFKEVALKEVNFEIGNLNPKKATTFKNIPINILKKSKNICQSTLHTLVNCSIRNSFFPGKLKTADISPIFKKEDATNVKNYRPVSVLPTVSKIYERILQKQLLDHIEQYLSPQICGYRKGYSAQYALVALLEKWKGTLDMGGYAGAMLMDLSKAFDTLDHELLLAKLYAYGVDKSALQLIRDYLTDRLQRTKVNAKFSSWGELLQGVPQGSVLGPLLFNIYINDMFWFIEQTSACNFADDTTLYACDMDIKIVLQRLEHDFLLSIEWFDANYMMLNEDKCHFIIAGNKYEHIWAKAGSSKIWESQRQKLLGVYIDRDLSFNYHITNLCKKANNKLTALIRLGKFYNLDQRVLLMKSFVQSQFAYSPLVWMFHDRGLNNKINNIHERALRFVYRDDVSSFGNLLKRDNSVTIHHRNIHTLATELYKVNSGEATDIISDIFVKNNNVGRILRSNNPFFLPQVNTVHFGHDSLKYFGSKVWGIIPHDIKSSESLSVFKSAIKKWIPSQCPCRLCRDYLQGVGYIAP